MYNARLSLTIQLCGETRLLQLELFCLCLPCCGHVLFVLHCRPSSSACNICQPGNISQGGIGRCMFASNRTQAVHGKRSCHRRALRYKTVCAALQTSIDIKHFVEHSKGKRLELLEVSWLNSLENKPSGLHIRCASNNFLQLWTCRSKLWKQSRQQSKILSILCSHAH